MRTILVVDDDDQLRTMIKLILTDAGYAVLEAATGGEVGAIYERQRPDLVITDLLMPDKEGLEVIIDLYRNNQRVRIIAMSGGGKISADSYLLLAQKFVARWLSPSLRNNCWRRSGWSLDRCDRQPDDKLHPVMGFAEELEGRLDASSPVGRQPVRRIAHSSVY